MFHVTTILIPPPLIPPLTRLKVPKGISPVDRAKSRLARTAGRAVRLCRPPRGRTSASLRGLTCHSCQAWVAEKKPLHGARRPPALSLATRMTRMVSQTSGSSPSSRACTPLAAPRAGARQPPRLPCWLLRRVRARSRGGGECTGAGVYSRAVRTPLHDAKLLTYVLLSVLLLLGPYLLRLRHAKQPAERGL